VKHLRPYLVHRAPLLGAAALLGLVSSWSGTKSGEHSEEGVREVLHHASELEVGAFVWEPSRGALIDYIFGRGILFEARTESESPRDIHRCFIRLTPEGAMLAPSSPRNLTRTRTGDEYGLAALGNTALYASSPTAGPASVTLVALEGERSKRSFDWLATFQIALSRWVDTGSLSGLGRSSLLVEDENQRLRVVLNEQGVDIETGKQSVQAKRAELFALEGPGPGPIQEGLHLSMGEREPIAWTHWGANTGRALFGNAAVAWMEGRLFTLLDQIHRVGHASPSTPKSASKPPLPKKKNAASHVSSWPPQDLKPTQRQGSDDGKWVGIENSVLERAVPPLMVKTVLHSDPERPYAELHLVAMDMRRLRLGMRAGHEDPEPDTGPPGSGHLPPDEAKDVIATFNGAFKASHGRYGMKAEGRTLVEPVEGAATVFVDEQDNVGFGTWDSKLAGQKLRSFRQNLEPLVGHGRVNPANRSVWGDHLYGSGVAVERSALCLHSSGHLIYAWATEATGMSLAEGLSEAGCVYALHLDMNPGHCAFLFNDVDSVVPLRARGEPLDLRMKVNENRYVRWSPKDFFYVARRANTPQQSNLDWEVAPGRGPSPTEIPAIFRAKKTLAGIEFELDRLDAGRLRYTVEPGSLERIGDDNQSWGVEEALISWGLGHRTRGSRTGLTSGSDTLVPLHRAFASLVLKEEAPPQLLPPGEPPEEEDSVQIIQFPALAREGEPLPVARELGGKERRSAMCVDSSGNLLIGRTFHDTFAPLVRLLLQEGCQTVVSLDRGSHEPPVVHRAGTETPPSRATTQTFLYGLPRAMRAKTRLHPR